MAVVGEEHRAGGGFHPERMRVLGGDFPRDCLAQVPDQDISGAGDRVAAAGGFGGEDIRRGIGGGAGFAQEGGLTVGVDPRDAPGVAVARVGGVDGVAVVRLHPQGVGCADQVPERRQFGLLAGAGDADKTAHRG